MTEGWNDQGYQERLSAEIVCPGEGKVQGKSYQCVNAWWWEEIKKTKSHPSQWCPLTGQDAISTNWNYTWTYEGIFFAVTVIKHWIRLLREGCGLPILGEGWSFKTWLDWQNLTLSTGTGQGFLQRCHPTSAILWSWYGKGTSGFLSWLWSWEDILLRRPIL